MTSSVFLKYTSIVLMIGFTLHLAGILFIVDGSAYTTISNLGLFLPALILCVCDKQLWKDIAKARYRPVLLLLAFSMLMALLNPDAITPAFIQFKTVLYVVLYLSAVYILGREGLLEKCLTTAFVLAGVFAIASLVLNFIQQDQNIFLSGRRLSSMGYGAYADFKNPIIAALYYGFFGVYGFHQLLTQRYGRWLRVLFVACVLGLSMYLFCTFSRGVWLGYGLAVCTTIFFHHNSRSRMWLYIAGAILLVLSVWLSPILIDQQSRGFSLRDLIWAGWLDRLKDFWLIGAGAGRAFDICILETQCFRQAHNLFLQYFYEYGVIGIGLMLLTVTCAFKCAMDRRVWTLPMGSVGLPVLIFGVVTAMFDYHTVLNRPGVYWIVFWLPIGIIVSQTAIMSVQRKGIDHAY